ncbi:MAG: FAD-dependent oxidoreductase, partial [Nitrososphaerales archaeon]
NGGLEALEEAKALGGGDLFEVLESIIIHRTGIPGEGRCVVYNCGVVEPRIREFLSNLGVKILLETRIVGAKSTKGSVTSVELEDGTDLEGDGFVDSSGGAGGIELCTKYGKGCIMCIYKCPAFGDRISISTKLGGIEKIRRRPSGKPGAVGAAISLHKTSLAPDLRMRLEREGTVLIPLPQDIIEVNLQKLKEQASGRTEEQMRTLNLVDIGVSAKIVGAAYMSPSMMRRLPGMEHAEIEEPAGAGKFNKITGLSIMQHDHALKVDGFSNLFCAGEHSGKVGVADCLSSGLLGGHNAVRASVGKELLTLSRKLIIGESIAYFSDGTRTGDTLQGKFGNMGQGPFFEHIKELGLFSEDTAVIRKRVADAGLEGIFSEKLV